MTPSGNTTSGGLVTILFTDLVGSTELLQKLGDDAGEAVRRIHFQLLREAVGVTGGQEVKNLGDGLMVVFSSALDAIGCAVAIQHAIELYNQEPGAHELQVRVGLHAGEPIREEDDYFGTPIVIAKRLCDSAQGGQIVASDLVRALIGSRGRFSFREIGTVELKGLLTPLLATEIVWRPNAITGQFLQAPKRPVPMFRLSKINIAMVSGLLIISVIGAVAGIVGINMSGGDSDDPPILAIAPTATPDSPAVATDSSRSIAIAKLDEWNMFSTTPIPGEDITLEYYICNLAPSPVAVGLGASIRQMGTNRAIKFKGGFDSCGIPWLWLVQSTIPHT